MGSFPGIYISLVKFGLKVHGSKGFTKMGFIYWVQMFALYLLASIVFFGHSFSNLICYFNYFFYKFNGTFSNSKKKGIWCI